jgi:isopenicillin N synthase-like dioxygenase
MTGATMQDMTVPTIDLSTCSADELADTLITWSCALVVGHGIPDELQRDMAKVSATFFDLAEAEKDHVRWPGSGMWHGWVPVYRGDPDLNKGGVPNLVEWFQVQDFAEFDLWPQEPAQMRRIWSEYYEACAQVTEKITYMLAEALELPEDDVPAWTSRQFCNLAVNNYPPQKEPPLPGQERLSPHTDENALTLLFANDAPGGLQIHKPGREEWVPVSLPAGTFFLQPGDLMARWTNRLIHANVHRVVNPPRELAATSRRQTVVFFQYPDRTTLVTPAPSCVARTGGEALEPLQAWDHLIRNQEAFTAGETDRRLDDRVVDLSV